MLRSFSLSEASSTCQRRMQVTMNSAATANNTYAKEFEENSVVESVDGLSPK
jgi:hypothetical protein